MQPWASCSLSILCLSILSASVQMRGGERSLLCWVTSREALPFQPQHLEGYTWRPGPQRPAMPPGRRWQLNQPPLSLAQSLGNLFPGPSRLSKPWPARPSVAGSGFPTFWFSHLPCPRHSPHPPPSRNWIQRGGECCKGGPGRGCRALLRQHQEWGSEESPQPRLRMGFGSASSHPASPRGWLGAHQKLEQATSLAASQSLL